MSVRGARVLIAALSGVMVVAACGVRGSGLEPNTWPTTPEVLPPAVGESADARLSCGGGPPTFDASALKVPGGAESAVGPEFDALRATFVKFGEAFPEAAGLSWRLAVRHETGATFLARAEAGGESEWISIDVSNTAGQWAPSGIGGCALMVVLSPEYGPATWALDPAYPVPTAASTELNILVWERACSSGRAATGRMSAPVVVYAAEFLTMTIGVKAFVDGDMLQTCPGPPGTPALVRLPEPLGDRHLLDGAFVPPVPPAPAF